MKLFLGKAQLQLSKKIFTSIPIIVNREHILTYTGMNMCVRTITATCPDIFTLNLLKTMSQNSWVEGPRFPTPP